jgi:hypothetical protein
VIFSDAEAACAPINLADDAATLFAGYVGDQYQPRRGLLGAIADIDLGEIDKRIRALRAEDIHIVGEFQVPSFYANLRRHGREDSVRKLNPCEWLVSAAA